MQYFTADQSEGVSAIAQDFCFTWTSWTLKRKGTEIAVCFCMRFSSLVHECRIMEKAIHIHFRHITVPRILSCHAGSFAYRLDFPGAFSR